MAKQDRVKKSSPPVSGPDLAGVQPTATKPSLEKSLKLALQSWLTEALSTTSKAELITQLFVVGDTKWERLPKDILAQVPEWLRKEKPEERPLLSLMTAQGPLLILRLAAIKHMATTAHDSKLELSLGAKARDAAGLWMRVLETAPFSRTHLHFVGCSVEQVQGFLLGCEIGAYRFKNTLDSAGVKPPPALKIWKDKRALDRKSLKSVVDLGTAINLARHLTNCPPNWLHPESYADLIRDLFKGSGLKVDVWDESRLKKERMRMLLAVGQAADSKPRLVQISWKPKVSKKKTLALVGKGVTFDSGGLDIKPAAAMKLMKKDMGGSASLVGLAYWISQSKPKVPCEIYLPLAENAVGSRAFRPGDILIARSGRSVEITNTDAEGRLVLADAMDLAVNAKEAPGMIIDLATLTGAIKVGLGADLAGLFSNNDALTKKLEKCATQSGEYVWRMPLFQKYRASMKSGVSDVTNSVEGFGGAVTAALFLENFVGKVPWAHFDIYAWTDTADGALLEAGGNGQMVQTLSRFISQY